MVAALALAISTISSLFVGSPEVGRWRSAADRDEYTREYRAALADLPAPSADLRVATRFGDLHVLRWDGPADSGLPVFLLPGRASGAPMWSTNLPDWIGRRTVLAVDPLGDAGLSTQGVPITSFDDQADWVSDTLAALGIARAHLVGHSFGGSTAAIAAVRHPDQVASLTLLEPVIVVHRLPLSTYFWAAVSQLGVLPQSWRDNALGHIGTGDAPGTRIDNPLARMIRIGSSGYLAAVPTPSELTDDQWRSLTMPVRLDVGGAGALAGGQDAVDRLHDLVPSARTQFWPDATHSLPMEKHAQLDPQLLAFWAAADQ